MNRPGGNVTGVNFFAGLLGAKRLELLRRLAPNAKPMAMLVNPNSPNNEAERRDVQARAQQRANVGAGREVARVALRVVGEEANRTFASRVSSAQWRADLFGHASSNDHARSGTVRARAR